VIDPISDQLTDATDRVWLLSLSSNAKSEQAKDAQPKPLG
jgi:hypothetical protein